MTIEGPRLKQKVRILSEGKEHGADTNKPRPVALTRLPSKAPEHPPEVRFWAPGEIRVLVKFLPEAFANLLLHCDQSNRHGREICGLLLGKPSQVDRNNFQGHLLLVTDILPLEAPDASGAHVSAAPETWAWAEAQIETRFEGKERLGWYHTHPTQGIFFSAADKDFHSIFTRPFQFALVVDPRVPEVGLFHWQDRRAGEIAGPFPLDQGTAPLRQASFRPSRRPRRDHRVPLLFLGLSGFLGLLAKAGLDAPGLTPWIVLSAAALLLRLWNAGVTGRTLESFGELRISTTTLIFGLAILLLSLSLFTEPRPAELTSAASKFYGHYKSFLWGLVIWVLFEAGEATRCWERHPWRPAVLQIMSHLKESALPVVIVSLAFTVIGLGVNFTRRGLEEGGPSGGQTVVLGCATMLAGAAVVLFVFTILLSRAGRPSPSDSQRGTEQ